MAGDQKLGPETINQVWRSYLTTGDVPEFIRMPWYQSRRVRALYHLLPDNPRCRLCHAPFHGIGGAIMRHAFGLEPSRLNPQVCNNCERFTRAFQGGAEVELTILFADVRGSTRLAEAMNPTEFGRLITRFYNAATKVLYASGAMVEKLIGDEVTGFFVPGIAGKEHARAAVEAARAIQRATGHGGPGGAWVPVGIGVHTGPAYVGSVQSDGVPADMAVLGDTANTGARLAALAGAGEILISQATAQAAGLDAAGVEVRSQALKGKANPIDVWVL